MLYFVPGLDDFGVHLISALRLDQAREFVGHFDALHPSAAIPNDGVSTVASAKWGLFRGCFPADHLDAVGQINDRPVDPRTGFAYLRFYRFIASDLGERGF